MFRKKMHPLWTITIKRPKYKEIVQSSISASKAGVIGNDDYISLMRVL